MTTLFVSARQGVRVTYEHQFRRYIPETPSEVPDTVYYRRMIACGDLISVARQRPVKGKKP
ncbi:hypothetical protein [Morganella psychrotolerans]|uniref:DUF2635 domain-containing protein n=1 Tax=Morganella psychrotolerans TaxID=368603 RepID=A0A1B8HRW6_9GAMM|nr:hypothetical protein [Morganella psychrotolerans]OBU12167.1 hypothetical protein AYY18_16715 [Morganella psychrotolerans]